MTENILENLSEEQVEAIKSSGGFSGSIKGGIDILEGPCTFKPSSSIPISGYEQGIRPSVGRPADQLIRGISKEALERGEAERKAFEAEQRAEAEALAQEASSLSNHALRRDHEILKRQVARLVKQIKKLEADAQST